MPKVNSSIANLSPWRIVSLEFFMLRPRQVFTTIIETWSLYKFSYLLMTFSLRPFLSSTCRHQVSTILQKAATRSVSRMPQPVLREDAACMASRAFATPCEMRRSPPVTSWLGEMVRVIDFLILAASMPVITLKSTLSREILRRSDIRRLFAFFPGLLPKTMREQRWHEEGLVPIKTLVIMLVNKSPIKSQCFL